MQTTRFKEIAQATVSGRATCRHCQTPLSLTFVDLGMTPLCESYLSEDQLNDMEPFYPLHAQVCEACFLVQLQEYVRPEAIFSEYAYFSSYADSWLEHASDFVDAITRRLGLNATRSVIEIGSNDGYLLTNFAAKGIPVLGIEPAANIAQAAIKKGVPTLVRFFNQPTAEALASEGRHADLLIGNNVLAQVPELDDFVEGLRILLRPEGVITMEFPHLLRLVRSNQFDTIYHEHFSYFSLLTVERIFAAHGLRLFDVDELPTHGGSLRIYARHDTSSAQPVSSRVTELRQLELEEGVTNADYYLSFAGRVKETKRHLLEFLIDAKRQGRSVVGYGAPGKGNTLLNYCGIRTDFLDYTVDRNLYKQGMYTPGTHIPIYSPQRIDETRPDYVLILPWNFKDEIMEQMVSIREWGGQFVVPIPEVAVL